MFCFVALVSCSGEILQPFLLGCDTKNLKIIQLCLQSVQRLISHEALSAVSMLTTKSLEKEITAILTLSVPNLNLPWVDFTEPYDAYYLVNPFLLYDYTEHTLDVRRVVTFSCGKVLFLRTCRRLCEIES